MVQLVERGEVGAIAGEHIELSTNPLGEFASHYWLGNKIADSEFHAFCASLYIVARGQHYDWNFGSDWLSL